MSGAIRRAGSLLMARLDEWLFPEAVTCLCCDRALDEAGEDGLCPACLRALDALRGRQEERERLCEPLPPELAFAHAAFPYEEQARRLILLLKFHSVRAAAVPLARAMAMLPAGEEEIIVPVPTSRRRLKERGFNQAELLARCLGHELGMPVCTLLERTQERRPQSMLKAEERRQNLAGCMRAGPEARKRRILLVDDVYTTGSTAKEAARALLDAGAASVGVLTAARTGRPEEDEDPFPLRRIDKNRTPSSKVYGKL